MYMLQDELVKTNKCKSACKVKNSCEEKKTCNKEQEKDVNIVINFQSNNPHYNKSNNKQELDVRDNSYTDDSNYSSSNTNEYERETNETIDKAQTQYKEKRKVKQTQKRPRNDQKCCETFYEEFA